MFITQRSRTRTVRTLSAAALGTLSLTALAADPVGQNIIEGARSALDRWVETRKLISQEQRDWTLGRELLQDRIGMIEREIQSLRERLAEAQKNISGADVKRDELVAESDALKALGAEREAVVASLESRVQALLPRLPEPLKRMLEPLTRLLPAPDAATKPALAERYRNAIGILNEVNKFNRTITVASEVREIAGGSSVEVTTVYVGIGAAYYVGSKGTIAGVGSAGENGWTWSPANEAAPTIASMVRILANEDVATFVKLPLDVR